MLKKFTTLLCVGALSVAFVGCEQAGDAVDGATDAAAGAADAATDAVDGVAEGAKDAVAAGAEKIEEGAAAVKDAAGGE